MDINELKEAKLEIEKIYENEKSLLNNNNNQLLEEELLNIKKEINKIDTLIDIYKNDNIKLKVMKLERLYMQNIADKSEEEFDNMSLDEKSDLFISSFPDNWSYDIPVQEKIKYLEEAIIDNKMINIQNNTKNGLNI